MRPILWVAFASSLLLLVAGGWWWRRRRRRLRARAWRQAHELFSRVVELPLVTRSQRLADATLDDPILLELVTSLLAAHDRTGPLDRLESRLIAAGTAAAEEPSPPVSPVSGGDELVAGHYVLCGRLGAGGMGEVFRARDLQLGRDIALKFLAPHQDPTGVARERFTREARAAAVLDHPNICTVHEIGETEDGRLYIAMALYDGETLADRIARGPLDWVEAVGIARQAARGLARAHAAGVVHRDIKPANLCITHDGIVKIVDFGIAMVAGTTIGDAGPLLGTVAYMSPEQVRGQPVDHRTDLWSLGVVLYEMLTGAKLFDGSGWLAILETIRAEGPVPCGLLRGTAPLPILRIVQQLLEREVDRRLASSDQLDLALGEAAADVESCSVALDDSVDHELAPGGERRRVTVLVARLEHPAATSAAQRAVAASRLDSAAREVIDSHGGRSESCNGECLIAFFGVPFAREDDQLRAARVAAELLELTGIGASDVDPIWPSLAIGSASGTVEVRDDPGMPGHYLVDGDLVQVAKRLAQNGPIGASLIADPDRHVLAPHFALEEIERSGADGSESSAAVARLIVRTNGVDPDVGIGFTPFTGRRHELEFLDSVLDGAIGGEGRVVSVLGEAGSGKSRLVHEFRDRLDLETVTVVACQCMSYEVSKPYHPFIEAVGGLLAVRSTDTPLERSAAAVRAAVERLDPMLLEFLPLYLHLLSVAAESGAESPPAEREPTRQAVRDALTALVTVSTRRRAVVLIIEDWHWADEASREVLRALREVSAAFPLLIVLSERPEGADSISVPGIALLRLAPLPPSALTAMACAVLGVPALPEGIRETLMERAGGNPLYLEELCRSLAEAGMLHTGDGGTQLVSDREPWQLPGTIQGIIVSRLDRLSLEAREVVRAAAVLGRDFTLPLLEQMGLGRYALDQILSSLAAPGLIRKVQVVPERGFRFSHALIQETAYDSLLQPQRIEWHRLAARAIAHVHADRLEEFAARIAWHHQQGEAWLEAARHGRLAARRSRALFETADALATLEMVDQWLVKVPANPEREELEVAVLLEQEELCENLGRPEQQGRILDRLIGLPAVQNDPARLADVHRRRGDRFTLLREFPQARMELDRALTLTREQGDEVLEGIVLRSLGLVGWHGGDAAAALHFVDQAIALERGRGAVGALATSLNSRGQILRSSGRYQEALDVFESALAVVEQTETDRMTKVLLFNIGMIHLQMGDPDRAEAYMKRITAGGVADHHPVFETYNAGAFSSIYLAQGEINRAVEQAERSVDEARRAGFSEGLARSLHSHGILLVSLGHDQEALPQLEEAAEYFARLEHHELERRVWSLVAGAAERSDDVERAHRAWQRVAMLHASGGAEAGAVRARIGLARTSRRMTGAVGADPRSELLLAVELADAGGLRLEAAAAQNSLGILEWERGEHRAAMSHFEAALAHFHQIGDLPHQAQMHNSLASTLRALGEPDLARGHLEEALTLSRKAGHQTTEGHALALLGELALDDASFDLARSLFRASMRIRCASGDRRGEGWMRQALARTESRAGRESAALSDALLLRGIALSLGDLELLEACDDLHTTIPIPMEG